MKPFPLSPQHPGLATTRELHDAGWSDRMIEHFAAHRGVRLFPRVYCEHRGTLTDQQLLVAAHLWAGPGTALTGAMALRARGLPLPGPPDFIRFLTRAAGRRRSFRGVTLARTRTAWVAEPIEGVPTVGVARALADLGLYAEYPRSSLQALTISALQRGLTAPDAVERELISSNHQRILAIGDAVRAFRAGAWSVPEKRLAELVASSETLPAMLTNPRLATLDGRFVGRPDAYFDDAGVAVQVHSRQFHEGFAADGRDLWAATVEKDNRLREFGVVVVGVTPTTLVEGPGAFVAQLEHIVRMNAGRPPLPLVVTPCAVDPVWHSPHQTVESVR